MPKWPITLIRRGAKVPDDGTQWWQELPADRTADGLRSVGYEVVEVMPTQEHAAALEGLKRKLNALALGPGPDRGVHYQDGWRRGIDDAREEICSLIEEGGAKSPDACSSCGGTEFHEDGCEAEMPDLSQPEEEQG